MEKELAGLIWEKLASPEVNLDNPETKIEFFLKGKDAVAGLFLSDTDKSYNKRKAPLRPEFHPSSLHPRLAKAMINLSGKREGELLDPFCGTGGILIEAGILGYKINGYDLQKNILEMCRKNLDFYGITKYNLVQKDSRYIKKKFDLIVTDLPYGKNSKADNLREIYLNFLNSSYLKTEVIVAGFPDFIDSRDIIKKTKWSIKKKFFYYLHKSLSKEIFILK